jgi:hypothetical protein
MPDEVVPDAVVDPLAFLLNCAKDNARQLRDARVAERTELAELQRVTSDS